MLYVARLLFQTGKIYHFQLFRNYLSWSTNIYLQKTKFFNIAFSLVFYSLVVSAMFIVLFLPCSVFFYCYLNEYNVW